MFFRTIRFRLILWYALSLAVVLAASGLFWYFYLANNLLRHVDEQISNVAQDVNGYMNDELKAGRPNDCRELKSFLHRHHNWGGFIAIQDQNGAITCASHSLGDIRLPLSDVALQRIHAGKASYETILSPVNGQQLRLLTVPAKTENPGAALIQVAENLGPMRHTLEDLRLLLLTFSPLALLTLSFGGWFLADKALAPVSRITRAARNINERNLSEQLPVDNSGDEIARLAETFNAMLTRLDEAFRKTRQFSADASHELRTPLTILKGETEVALRWAKTSEEFHDILLSNLEEIDRMGRMIEDLLALAKSDAGEVVMERHSFSLSDMLQHLYLQTKSLGDAGGVGISFDHKSSEEVQLIGDELRLRQVFLNLISNAIKYTPAGGRIELTLDLEEEIAVVAIRDTGIGIPAEHLPHIFDRFYRIDKARNRRDGGTGLGLSIVKSIVEAHAGTIDVESVVASGSVFTVRLPLAGPSLPHTAS